MSVSVVVSSDAEDDLDAIVVFIAEHDGFERAQAVEDRIVSSIETLKDQPDRGRVIPELHRQGVFAYRELLAGPWRILYRRIGREVRILAVIDGRRDFDAILRQRLHRG